MTDPQDIGRPEPTITRRISDVILVVFARMANRDELSLSLTVSVPGGVVSGRLIGGRQYFRALDTLVRESGLARGLGLEEGMSDAYPTDEEAEGSNDGLPPMFLHFMDARLWGAAPRPMPSGGRGHLYRVRLEDVTAWTLGSLAEGE
jgi:hypothetical protein